MVHVYINGLYWGVHNLCERQDAAHYAAYHGGREDLLDARNGSSWIDGDATAWNAMKSVGVRYDFAWTTGVANNNGFFNSDVNSSTYNAATATYSYLHQVSGAKILVDDGCGGNVDEDWSPSSASTLNSLIGSGVMAFNHCASLASDYQSLITAIEPQLNSTCN